MTSNSITARTSDISYSLGKLRVIYNVYFDDLEFTIKTGFWRTLWNPSSGDIKMDDDGPWWDQARKLLTKLEGWDVAEQNVVDAREEKRKANLNKDWNR